jgi:hypothetical protein
MKASFIRALRPAIIAAESVVVASLTFGCSTRQPPEPVTTLWLEGSVIKAADSTPFPGVYVTVRREASGGSETIAGTRTGEDGRYVLLAGIATAECSATMLHVGIIGFDPGIAREPALRCTDDCQRLDFALVPPAVSAHSIAEPRVGACKS